ncbi:hypothetical protein V5O48_015630 [Marasmius crinis-equi]|uniref:Uncharacterized protein n=1 Tax=Marasmius crinis-equi TaxID=585013 RepID=A0ABR3ETZ2_9AGAR
MSVLRFLKKIPSPYEHRDGITVKDRLHGQMNDVVRSIKDCAKLCDAFQRKSAAVRFFTSFKWQPKFASVAEQFTSNGNAIQSVLQLYTWTYPIPTLNQNVSPTMKMVFEQMQSATERNIAAAVHRKGSWKAGDSIDPELIKEINQIPVDLKVDKI